jgi:hypothetical protein
LLLDKNLWLSNLKVSLSLVIVAAWWSYLCTIPFLWVHTGTVSCFQSTKYGLAFHDYYFI